MAEGIVVFLSGKHSTGVPVSISEHLGDVYRRPEGAFSTSHTNDFMLRLSCSGPAASGETIVEPEISDSTAIAEAVNTSPAKHRSRYCPHGRTTVSACTNGMLQRFSSQRLSRLTNVSQTNATCSLRHDAITFASGFILRRELQGTPSCQLGEPIYARYAVCPALLHCLLVAQVECVFPNIAVIEHTFPEQSFNLQPTHKDRHQPILTGKLPNKSQNVPPVKPMDLYWARERLRYRRLGQHFRAIPNLPRVPPRSLRVIWNGDRKLRAEFRGTSNRHLRPRCFFGMKWREGSKQQVGMTSCPLSEFLVE